MKNEKQFVGKRGEEEGCGYLRSLGYSIIGRNWRSGHLELDIIALAPDGLHFVEVKSRKAPVMAQPQENVGPVKQKRLVSAAKAYLRDRNRPQFGEKEVFFDVLTVIFNGDDADIEYYPKAFIPIYV